MDYARNVLTLTILQADAPCKVNGARHSVLSAVSFGTERNQGRSVSRLDWDSPKNVQGFRTAVYSVLMRRMARLNLILPQPFRHSDQLHWGMLEIRVRWAPRK